MPHILSHNSLSALGAFLPVEECKLYQEKVPGHNSLSALGAFLPHGCHGSP